MKLYLTDHRDLLLLATEDESVTIGANVGVIASPDGDDVKFLSICLPTSRAYLARHLYGSDASFSIVVLPEGLTPATFGWDDWALVKLSVLVDKFKEDTK